MILHLIPKHLYGWRSVTLKCNGEHSSDSRVAKSSAAIRISPNTAAIDTETKEKKNLLTLGISQTHRDLQ